MKRLLILLLFLVMKVSAQGLLVNSYRYSAVGTDPATFSPTVLLYDNVGVLDATDVACSEGENVKTWQDQSGNANHLAQATAGNRPVWNSGLGITFDGSSDYLTKAATFAIARPKTTFIVLKYLGPDLVDETVQAGVFSQETGAVIHTIRLRGGSYNGAYSRSNDGGGNVDVNASPSAVATLNANTRVVLVGVYSATAQKVIWNGNVATGAASSTSASTGDMYLGVTGTYANMQVRALVVILSELTAQQIIDVTTWLDINFP